MGFIPSAAAAASGAGGPVVKVDATIYQIYVTSTGDITGPPGWTASRWQQGTYFINPPSDLLPDLRLPEVCIWGAYIATSGGGREVAVTMSSSALTAWTYRSLDGGLVDSNFYIWVAVGPACRKIVWTGNTGEIFPGFTAPDGWTVNRTNVGQYTVNMPGVGNIDQREGGAAFAGIGYGQTGEGVNVTALPSVVNPEQINIETRRQLDGALIDKDAILNVLVGEVEGCRALGGNFQGDSPPGWTVTGFSGGLSRVDPQLGVFPILPVQDGLGIMVNCLTGQAPEFAGFYLRFFGQAFIEVHTYRQSDGADNVDKIYNLALVQGNPPE